MKDNYSNNITSRASFLMKLLNKAINEYKAIILDTRRVKPFKIVEILSLSDVPGETLFVIQVSYKNCTTHLSAAELISTNYNLDDFSDFHAEIIRQAALGKLSEFLRLSEPKNNYRIVSKKFIADTKQYIFTIETPDNILFARSADELSENKALLAKFSIEDIYDIAHTQGCESILEEESSLQAYKKCIQE